MAIGRHEEVKQFVPCIRPRKGQSPVGVAEDLHTQRRAGIGAKGHVRAQRSNVGVSLNNQSLGNLCRAGVGCAGLRGHHHKVEFVVVAAWNHDARDVRGDLRTVAVVDAPLVGDVGGHASICGIGGIHREFNVEVVAQHRRDHQVKRGAWRHVKAKRIGIRGTWQFDPVHHVRLRHRQTQLGVACDICEGGGGEVAVGAVVGPSVAQTRTRNQIHGFHVVPFTKRSNRTRGVGRHEIFDEAFNAWAHATKVVGGCQRDDGAARRFRQRHWNGQVVAFCAAQHIGRTASKVRGPRKGGGGTFGGDHLSHQRGNVSFAHRRIGGGPRHNGHVHHRDCKRHRR